MTSLILYITRPIDFDNLYSSIIKYKDEECEIISLSPYSSYLLEKKGIKYKRLYDVIDKTYLHEKSLALLKILEEKYETIVDNKLYLKYLFQNYRMLCFIFRNNLLSYELKKKYTQSIVFSNLPLKKDIKYTEQVDNSFLYLYNLKAKKFIYLQPRSNRAKKQKIIFNKYLGYKILNKFFKTNISREWVYFFSKTFIQKKQKFICNISLKEINYFKLPNKFYINENKLKNLLKKQFLELSGQYKFEYLGKYLFSTMHMGNEYERDYCAFKNKIKHFCWQHGSYFYKGLFLKYYEINHNKINFVFNDYTKKLFEDLGAKKVYSVGSLLFNKPIKEKKKKYDFLYITQGHDYTGNLQYVDFSTSLHSFDGYELYQRHKSIIKLFGEKFKDKKIVIRVHPTVVTNGVYVPFWELSEPYPNVVIEVSTPIHTLIEKSKYIISDYFTTEFINRELHYKRDIILFQGAPTPLPEETLEDMTKMFILIDTVDELENKVKNIKQITKSRKRYDDIIEYYSSKKCDTKKVVTEILKKELNARN